MHTTSFKDLARFIEDLKEEVLNNYLNLANKDATYVSGFTVSLFVKEISDWMQEQTMKEMQSYDDFSLLLDEGTDESNRFELLLVSCVVKSGEIAKQFLGLLQLRLCDAKSIFNTVEKFLKDENVKITNVHFSDMVECSTKSRIYNGVRYFEKSSEHLVYIYCRNHRLALCFIHLIPKYEDFVKFDSLLLNLFLLLKNSRVKSTIFEGVQTVYGLTSLKLIKAAVTRWLSCGKAAERVLDCCESLVVALDAI